MCQRYQRDDRENDKWMKDRTPMEWNAFAAKAIPYAEGNSMPFVEYLAIYADAVRQEALREAAEICIANYTTDGTAQKCFKEIMNL